MSCPPQLNVYGKFGEVDDGVVGGFVFVHKNAISVKLIIERTFRSSVESGLGYGGMAGSGGGAPSGPDAAGDLAGALLANNLRFICNPA